MRTYPVSGLLLALTVSGIAACAGAGESDDARWDGLLAVLELEDARPSDPEGRGALEALTRSADARTRAFAVRALGRLEDPVLLGAITPLLEDADPGARAAAAWAVAQAVHGSDGTPALAPLLTAASTEQEPDVRGELARSLGRIRPGGRGAEAALDAMLPWTLEGTPQGTEAEGLALGLEGLARAPGPVGADDRLHEALDALARRTPAAAEDPTLAAHSRAVAVLALGQRGRLTPGTLRAALEDAHPSVRTAAARFLGTVPTTDRAALTARALADAEASVRVEGIRALAAEARDGDSCGVLLDVARSDRSGVVRAVALDALGEPCPDPVGRDVLLHLEQLAASVPGEEGWFEASTALTALARVAPASARAVLPAHVRHENPFARAAAAAVAGMLGDGASLRPLAADPDPNVRTAALPSLFTLEGRALDSLLVDQLASDDGQLLITAARLLEDAPAGTAPEAALAAFERVSQLRRQTSRDARMALLRLVARQGGPEFADRVMPFLADFDDVVAAEAAVVLTGWTGAVYEVRPEPPSRLARPDRDDLAAMEEHFVVLHMARGGEIAVELLPSLAPTNAYRFYRLARDGYFEGLTFHRVEPNFVIQGGSQGANEYAGDGPFTRDEIGRISHWRGTVGLSTRGRDTGDGQIFVNLVDNVRLDHDYTVFGTVVSGLDTVDEVRPGDVIDHVEIRPRD